MGGEVVGAGEGFGGGVVEEVVFGGGDGCGVVAAFAVGVDGDLDEVVVVGAVECGGDVFGSGFAGGRVGCQDLVANVDFFDGFGFAVGEEYSGSGGEAVAEAVGDSCAFCFCPLVELVNASRSSWSPFPE